MSGDQIHYEELAQEALRGVIRTVLQRVAKTGGVLPGDHHFYIAFDTQADGVMLSKRLKEQYPEEMTIVLQHQFRDFKVTDTYFEVGLSFNGIPEHLKIPFKAIKVFFDPSVPYGLQFGAADVANDDNRIEQIMPEIISDKEEVGGAPSISEPSQVPEQQDTEADEGEKDEETTSAKILELDTFRKKES